MNKLRTINPEQLASLLRTVLQGLGFILATYGVMDAATWATVSGPILALAITVWGIAARSDENLIKSAAAVPAVEKIVAPGTDAAKDAAARKVTSS